MADINETTQESSKSVPSSTSTKNTKDMQRKSLNFNGFFNKKRKIAIILLLTLFIASIPLFLIHNKLPVSVKLWLTAANDDRYRLYPLSPIDLETKYYFDGSTDILRIKIDPSEGYQKMQGFGAAMTDSSAWLLRNVLNSSEYERTMRALFDPDSGIGISYLRIPLGASDCALDFYSFDDTPWNLDDFSIAHDEAYLIPVLQDALKLNPALKFIGPPWSPPGWMKVENNLTRPETKGLIGGTLNRSLYQLYAEYLMKVIFSYLGHGINISALTIQNEQFFVPESYPGSYLGTNDTKEFVKIIGHLFREHNISTEIYILDHNWVYSDQAIEILSDPQANEYIDGIAWHGYESTEPERQSSVKTRFPDKHHLFTEISGLQAYPNFADNLVWTFHNVFTGSIRNWAEGVLFWNLALDQFGGPILHQDAGLRGVITIPRNGSIQISDVIFDGEYYMLAHFTKFIKPEAIRIESMYFPDQLETLAFRNPDGSIVVVLCNLSNNQQKIKLEFDFRANYVTIPSRSLISAVFEI